MLNLTQHPSTPEQRAQGVVDLEGEDLQALRGLLPFEQPPTAGELAARATMVAGLAVRHGATSAMVGGAPFFMAPLEQVLHRHAVQPFHGAKAWNPSSRTGSSGNRKLSGMPDGW